jgi:phosphatidylserine/phosphatidylglycerophosphate/cardiolipin synthase-like enzyme
MHAKYMVIDRQVGVITNQNLTYSAFESNREIGVVTTRREDVAALAAIFDADWIGDPLPKPTGRLIVSPQNARVRLLEIIDGSDQSIDLYAEVVRDDQIIDALSSAAQRGVEVRLIVNRPESDLDTTVYDVLRANSVQIRTASGLYIHAKAMVVDGRVAVVGSQNPTATSLDENREVSLVLDDRSAARRIEVVFADDWRDAAPYSN